MNLDITYRHLESTPAIDQRIREKAEHLKKYFQGNADVHWTCSIEGERHISDVNVHVGKMFFHARAEDQNLYKTFDEVLSKIERQLRDQKDKAKNRIHLNA